VPQLNFIIVTGLSGAGKSQVVRVLDDLGFYCIDNIPPALIPKFAEMYYKSDNAIKQVALVSDIRTGDMFDEFLSCLDELSAHGYNYEILFLHASDEVLIKRYKETRRRHPLSTDGERVTDAITKEREIMTPAQNRATHIIDTSNLANAQLKELISSIYSEDKQLEIFVNVISFGFKHGVPLDADLVFDVRFLPNPFYIPELKPRTGLEKSVSDYVMKHLQTTEFLQKLNDMIEFLLPHYIKEGKSQLVIAIGCTGGQHRSVAIAEEFAKRLKSNAHHVSVLHRELKKQAMPVYPAT